MAEILLVISANTDTGDVNITSLGDVPTPALIKAIAKGLAANSQKFVANCLVYREHEESCKENKSENITNNA